jgi:hypothetical protein
MLNPNTQRYIDSHYRRIEEQKANQLQSEKERILAAFLAPPSPYQDTPNNRKLLKRYMGSKFYDFSTLQEVARIYKTRLEHVAKVSRPLGREVSAAELEDWFKRIAAASPWFALSARNINICTNVFLSDPRIPLTHNLQDLIAAIELADCEHRLDRNAPPPPPPKPTYQEEGLEDWMLPMPSEPYVLRRATLEQVKNYCAREYGYKKWLAEQAQQSE